MKGSDKAFNFCCRGEGDRLFVFEAPIDLLSFLCLFKKDWQKQSCLSLGGEGEKALVRFLSDRKGSRAALVKINGGTTFDIHIHFSETCKETFTDKVWRLIQNDHVTD